MYKQPGSEGKQNRITTAENQSWRGLASSQTPAWSQGLVGLAGLTGLVDSRISGIKEVGLAGLRNAGLRRPVWD